MAIATSPEVAARVAADEENFLDRALPLYFLFTTREAELR